MGTFQSQVARMWKKFKGVNTYAQHWISLLTFLQNVMTEHKVNIAVFSLIILFLSSSSSSFFFFRKQERIRMHDV